MRERNASEGGGTPGKNASAAGVVRETGARASPMALVAVFTALAAALGYALAWVPNVELITFTVFASGVTLGRWRGALVGALAMALYSGLNPVGSGIAVPPIYIAQILGASLSGLIGGTARRIWVSARPSALPSGSSSP